METNETKRNLPYTVIASIFSRLPIESLMRFTCLSKTWYKSMKNQDFVNLHLSRSKS
ncbi:hypothetical protein GIB67_023022, partial [Kingdonia uniflora]